jgi:hypothetical protein
VPDAKADQIISSLLKNPAKPGTPPALNAAMNIVA